MCGDGQKRRPRALPSAEGSVRRSFALGGRLLAPPSVPRERFDGDAEAVEIGWRHPSPPRSDAVDAMNRPPHLDPRRADRDLHRGMNGSIPRLIDEHGAKGEAGWSLRRLHRAEAGLYRAPRLSGEPPLRERGRKNDEPVRLPAAYSERTRPRAARSRPSIESFGPSGAKLSSVPTGLTSNRAVACESGGGELPGRPLVCSIPLRTAVLPSSFLADLVRARFAVGGCADAPRSAYHEGRAAARPPHVG